jgi:hypothetical protein
VLHGACLCGKVQYEVIGKPLVMYHCHCGMCRAASGASFGTNLAVATPDFRVVAGQALLKGFESSPGNHRFFCSDCGSQIYSHNPSKFNHISLRCGSLRDDPDVRPSFHIQVGSKASWVSINDGLRTYTGNRE